MIPKVPGIFDPLTNQALSPRLHHRGGIRIGRPDDHNYLVSVVVTSQIEGAGGETQAADSLASWQTLTCSFGSNACHSDESTRFRD